jgi:hypothetical protein
MINKFGGFDDNGKPFSGWTCGWCPLENNGSSPKPFQSMNATKALVHVAKVSGYDIRHCRGRIPAAKSRQYQDLHLSKTSTKEQRNSRWDTMSNYIADMQDRTVLALAEGAKKPRYDCTLLHVSLPFLYTLSPRSSSAGSTDAEEVGGEKEDSLSFLPALKRSWTVTESSSLSSSTPRTSTPGSLFNPRGKKVKGAPVTQMKLCGNAVDPNAPACMDAAIADFIHSHLLPFLLAQDPKLMILRESTSMPFMLPTGKSK